MKIEYNDLKGKTVETKAVIQDIELNYELDGKVYANIKIPNNAGAEYLKEGSNQVVYYHEKKPTYLMTEIEDNLSRKRTGIFVCCMGGFVYIVGIFGKDGEIRR